MAWKDYFEEYWLKELQESMDSCTCFHISVENGIKHHTNTINPLPDDQTLDPAML